MEKSTGSQVVCWFEMRMSNANQVGIRLTWNPAPGLEGPNPPLERPRKRTE